MRGRRYWIELWDCSSWFTTRDGFDVQSPPPAAELPRSGPAGQLGPTVQDDLAGLLRALRAEHGPEKGIRLRACSGVTLTEEEFVDAWRAAVELAGERLVSEHHMALPASKLAELVA